MLLRGCLRLSLVAALVGGCRGAPAQEPPPVAAQAHPESDDGHGRRGIHGMVVVGGGDAVFLSHIPAMRAPHDFQIVLEAAGLRSANGQTMGFADGLYTFEPEPFSLDDLRAGALTTFRGDVYRGNFEGGGTVLAKGVTVRVRKVVFSRALSGLVTPDSAATGYVLFGSKAHAYMLREIRNHGDVDQIVAVRLASPAPDLASAPRRTLPTSHRLAVGERFPGGRVEREVSCLVGPDFAQPCAAR